ncbi:MAG: biotin/lipoyl-binding protein [Rhodopirellula sp. JB044]|uniref:biotin/lipoyl-binding protein n=1 Tax=Rhodopirellula sp. JB044 TaxID=3342844 RepID=UPI00370BAFF9
MLASNASAGSGAISGSEHSGDAVGRVNVSVIRAGDVSAPLLFESYRGEVRAKRSSWLSMRRSGRLHEILVHEGDAVAEGDVLARLGTSDLDVREMMADADVAAASASLAEAIAGPREQTKRAASARVRQLESQLQSAEKRLSRQEQLSRRSAGTEQELDDAKFAVDEMRATLASRKAELEELEDGTRAEQVAFARARLESAKASRRQVDVDRDDSQIVAPYSGVIAIRRYDEGEMIGPNQGVLQILEVEPVEARFGVPPEVCRGWKKGARFWVGVNPPKEIPPSATPASNPARTLGPSTRHQQHAGHRLASNQQLTNVDRDPAEAIKERPETQWSRTESVVSNRHAGYYCGEVVRMQPQVDDVTRTRGVDVELSRIDTGGRMHRLSSDALHIGQTATLWVPSVGDEWDASSRQQSLSDPFWVPTDSLVRGVRGLWSVYVAVPEECERKDKPGEPKHDEALTGNQDVEGYSEAIVQRREVQVLRTAGSLTLVHGMLSPGEWIVAEGVGQIGPGVAVRVRMRKPMLSQRGHEPVQVSRR